MYVDTHPDIRNNKLRTFNRDKGLLIWLYRWGGFTASSILKLHNLIEDRREHLIPARLAVHCLQRNQSRVNIKAYILVGCACSSPCANMKTQIHIL
jgi:hypothetical protein